MDEVSRNDIRRKLEVYCFDCPLHYDDAVGARARLSRPRRAGHADAAVGDAGVLDARASRSSTRRGLREKTGGIRTDVPTAYPKGVNTATEWEYFEPLYPGDTLEGNWRLVEIKPRQTRLGDGMFLTTETTIFKRSGELVAKNRNTGFRYDEKTGDGAAREARAARTGRSRRRARGDGHAGRPVRLERGSAASTT